MDRRTVLLLLAGSAAAGCGLAEYEEKMKQQQEHIEQFEEQDRLLGDGVFVKLPSETEVGKESKLFLRLPRGVSGQQDDTPPIEGIKFATFNRTASSCAFVSVTVAIIPPPETPAAGEQRKEGADQQRLDDFIKKVKERRYGFKADQLGETIKRLPLQRPPIEYQAYWGEQRRDGSLSMNLYTGTDGPAAVIFVLDRDKDSKSYRRTLELVLDSVGVGPLADRYRSEYQKRNKAKSGVR